MKNTGELSGRSKNEEWTISRKTTRQKEEQDQIQDKERRLQKMKIK